ncbi:MAG: sulfatase [Alphaproteobacteria bacterium]|nr:sulfatase [Alphaproteobacteria bacterium]
MSRIWILLSLAAVAAAGILTVRDMGRADPVNVVVITVESWRADTISERRMPALLEAARQGVSFDRHRAVSAWTAPNVIAVLTGLSPFDQGVHARGHSVPEEMQTFTERLSDTGWHVGGVQAFMLIDLFKNLGFEFEPGTDPLTWIASHARRADPFFFWFHYLDSHLPYDPRSADAIDAAFPTGDPAERARRAELRALPAIPVGQVDFQDKDRPWIEALYRGGFEDFDEWFARFWAFFEAAGLDQNTILIVTADHGEELLERGNVGHASTTRRGHLHEEIVRVPLFVWAPEHLLPVAPGTRVDAMTDHLMIVPTLAAMLGLETRGDWERAGLFSEPRRTVWAGVTSEAGFSEPEPDRVSRYFGAILDGDTKVQIAIEEASPPGIEVWDLADDPGEREPLSAVPDRARTLADELALRLAAMRVPVRVADTRPVVSGAPFPNWVHPNASRAIRYADIDGRAYLEWTGEANGAYVVEYSAGSGLLALSGTFDVVGTRHDFGSVSEGYWQTWVVPYDRIRFRVREAADPDAGSDGLELEVLP